MGRPRQIKFLERTAQKTMTDKEEWEELLKYLEIEHSVRAKVVLGEKSKSEPVDQKMSPVQK